MAVKVLEDDCAWNAYYMDNEPWILFPIEQDNPEEYEGATIHTFTVRWGNWD